RGHNVSIFVEGSSSNKIYLHSSIKLTLLKGRSRAARLCNLAKYLRSEHCDIVHTITPLLTLQALIAITYARHPNTKIIGSYHGYGHFSSSHGILGYLSYLLTPIITRLADKNICVSDALKADLVDHWGAKPNNLVTIYNPVMVPGLPAAIPQGGSS